MSRSKRIISFAGIPAEIDDSIIGFLMRQVQPDGLIAARCNIKIGQQVTIEGGPFEGLVGIIQEPPNGKGRVKVLLQLLKQATKVDIPVQFIKAGWVPQGRLPRIVNCRKARSESDLALLPNCFQERTKREHCDQFNCSQKKEEKMEAFSSPLSKGFFQKD